MSEADLKSLVKLGLSFFVGAIVSIQIAGCIPEGQFLNFLVNWTLIGLSVSTFIAFILPDSYYCTVGLHPLGWAAIAILGYYALDRFTNKDLNF